MPAALVTGAASGIGKATAERLRADGYDVLGFDLEDGDLTTREGNERAVAPALERFGRLDLVVANAGVQHVAPVREFPEDRWDQIIAILLTSPFLLAKHAWDALAATSQGRFIVVASAHALVASPYKAAYVAAKHGVLGLVKTLALEGGEAGITATAVCPGYVRTPLVEAQIPDQAATHDMSEDEVLEEVILQPHADQAADRAGGGRGRDRVPGRPGRSGVQRRARDHGPRLERAIELPDRLTELLEHATRASDPEVALRALTALRRELDAFERVQAWRALDGGASYGAVARSLGISRQAAHRRYRELAAATEPPPGGEPVRLRVAPEARAAVQLAAEEAAALGAVPDGLRAPAARHPARRRRRRAPRRCAPTASRSTRPAPPPSPRWPTTRRPPRASTPSPPTRGACSARRCARPRPTPAT